MTNVVSYEFYSGKKPTAKLRKAIDKVFTDELIDKLVKLGLMRITIGSSKDFIRIIKDKKSIL